MRRYIVIVEGPKLGVYVGAVLASRPGEALQVHLQRRRDACKEYIPKNRFRKLLAELAEDKTVFGAPHKLRRLNVWQWLCKLPVIGEVTAHVVMV